MDNELHNIKLRKHTKYICTCGNGGCMYCDGGLFFCTVCRGMEGSLTTECPGFPLNEFIMEAVYRGGLDFIGNAWRVVVSLCEHAVVRSVQVSETKRYYRCGACNALFSHLPLADNKHPALIIEPVVK